MKLRTLIIVTVTLAVVTIAGCYIRNASLTTPQDDPLVGTSLLEQEVLKDIHRIEIKKTDSDAILEISDTGDWVVRSLYDLPADFAKLNTLIRDITSAKVQRKITSREDRIERLDLTQGTVKLMTGADDVVFEVTYGKSLSGGGRAFVFGREKTAYQSSTSPFIDANSNNWAVKTLYQFEADEVAGIQFSLTGETWGVRRDDKDKDFISTVPADVRIPKNAAIKSLLNRFTNLRFLEVSERATEQDKEIWRNAQENTRTIKFTFFSGETVTVKMSQWSPPEPEGEEEAPPSSGTETTYLHISSSQADHPINGIMDRLAFTASSYSFSGIPVELSEVADFPEPETETTEDGTSVSVPQENTNPGQPEIKQHIDGNSVIFEVTPPQTNEEPEEGSGPDN
jgi:hypothetical protein